MARRRDGHLTSHDISLPQDFKHLYHLGVESSRDEIVDVMLPLPRASGHKTSLDSPTPSLSSAKNHRYSPSAHKSTGAGREMAVDVPNDSSASLDCYEKPRHSGSSIEAPTTSRIPAPRSPRMGVQGMNGEAQRRHTREPSNSSLETPIFVSEHDHTHNARNIQMGLDGVLYSNVPEASFGPYHNIHALGPEARKGQPPPLPPKREKKWTMQQDESIVVLRESVDAEPSGGLRPREPSAQITTQQQKIRPPTVAQEMERPGFLGMGLGLDDPIPLSTPPLSYTPHEPLLIAAPQKAPPAQLNLGQQIPIPFSRSFSSEPPLEEAPCYEPATTSTSILKADMAPKRAAPLAAPRISSKSTPAPQPPVITSQMIDEQKKKAPPPRPPPPAQWLKPNLVPLEKGALKGEESVQVRPSIIKESPQMETSPSPFPKSPPLEHRPKGLFRKRSEVKLERVRSLHEDFVDRSSEDEEEDDSSTDGDPVENRELADEKENTIIPEEPEAYPAPKANKFAPKNNLPSQTIRELQEQLSIRKDRNRSHEEEIKLIATDLSSSEGHLDEIEAPSPVSQYSNPPLKQSPHPRSPIRPAPVHRTQSDTSVNLPPPPLEPYPVPQVSPNHALEMLTELNNLDEYLGNYGEELTSTAASMRGASEMTDLQYIMPRLSSRETEYPGVSRVDPLIQEVFAGLHVDPVHNFEVLEQAGQYPAGELKTQLLLEDTEYNVPRPISEEEKRLIEARIEAESGSNQRISNQEPQEPEEPRGPKPVPKPRRRVAPLPPISLEDSTRPITIRL